MVYITGDIHGDTTPVHELFDKCQPTEKDIIVLLGDVGINYTGQIRDRLMKQELSRLKSTFFLYPRQSREQTAEYCVLSGKAVARWSCDVRRGFPEYPVPD